MPPTDFRRRHAALLAERLAEPRRHIHVVAGPRQVGKTTLVDQVLGDLGERALIVSADEPTLRDGAWLAAQWERARLLAAEHGNDGAVLAVDEVQKLPNWSETVKRLWDEDTRKRRKLRVVLLGSAPLLVHQGLSESLAGRFELLYLPHWSLDEMSRAFGHSLDTYVFHGGYPGAAPLVKDHARWRRYLQDSLIETTISRDVLLMTRVTKPALLRQLFELGSRHSGQVLSYTKMLGQLQDAGNTTTLAHYLDLLSGAGLVTGLPKYTANVVRQRGSSPKLLVRDTALMTAPSALTPKEARADTVFWGHLVESAVGAHLAAAAAEGRIELFYWRERNHEVDFVVRRGKRVVAIEVKSGRAPTAFPGLAAIEQAFKIHRLLVVGGDGIPLADFLTRPVEHWVDGGE